MVTCACKKCKPRCDGTIYDFRNGTEIPLDGKGKRICYTCRVAREHANDR